MRALIVLGLPRGKQKPTLIEVQILRTSRLGEYEVILPDGHKRWIPRHWFVEEIVSGPDSSGPSGNGDRGE